MFLLRHKLTLFVILPLDCEKNLKSFRKPCLSSYGLLKQRSQQYKKTKKDYLFDSLFSLGRNNRPAWNELYVCTKTYPFCVYAQLDGGFQVDCQNNETPAGKAKAKDPLGRFPPD